jgi:hypothetical protein
MRAIGTLRHQWHPCCQLLFQSAAAFASESGSSRAAQGRQGGNIPRLHLASPSRSHLTWATSREGTPDLQLREGQVAANALVPVAEARSEFRQQHFFPPVSFLAHIIPSSWLQQLRNVSIAAADDTCESVRLCVVLEDGGKRRLNSITGQNYSLPLCAHCI